MLHHTVHEAGPDAEWVVFLHGAGVTSEIWERQVDAYAAEYNLLLPDLRGHGRSQPDRASGDAAVRRPHTWEAVGRDVVELMDHHGIDAAHLVGVSMGSILARQLADTHPGRVRSMIMSGAVVRLNRRARLLIALAHVLKHLVPHTWLYAFYAWILLPRPSHRESRRLVVGQARQLSRAEFLRWLPVSRNLPARLEASAARDPGVPTLYVSGDQDHMFIAGAKEAAAAHPSASLHIVKSCGHVCSVQRAEEFNRVSLEFLRRL